MRRLDAVHLVRRSYSTKLADNPLNIVLGCRECHEVFDNKPSERDNLKNIDIVKKMVAMLDEGYFNLTFKKR